MAVVALNMRGAETMLATEPDRAEQTGTTISIRSDTSLEDKFSQALIEEETNPNLEVAAQAYREVIAGLDGQRKMAATVILRLGECYRKQGKTNEAIAQFERLVRDFSEQSRAVETAQSRLHELAPGRTALASGARKTLSAEQVKLLRDEIHLVESQLETAEKLYREGRASAEERSNYQQELFTLQRQLPENLNTEKQKEILEKQIQLVETRLNETREKIKAGIAPVNEAASVERELLGLKRELLDIGQAAPTASIPVDKPVSEEDKEIQRLKAIVKESPDLINAKDRDGNTLLHKAVANNFLSSAAFLLTNGANVNAQQSQYFESTPLHLAVDQGHLAMVELLIKQGANVDAKEVNGATPLLFAAAKGFLSIAKLLIDHKADVNISGAMAAALDTPSGLVGFGTPLQFAAVNGHIAVIELLLNHEARIEEQQPNGRTALFFAVQSKNFAAAECLLKHHANVNMQSDKNTAASSIMASEIRLTHDNGVSSGQHGGDFNAPTLGSNFDLPRALAPLLLAVQSAQPEMVNLLLKYHADVTVRDEYGRAPLRLAFGLFRDSNPSNPSSENVKGEWKKIIDLLRANPIAAKLERMEQIALYSSFGVEPESINWTNDAGNRFEVRGKIAIGYRGPVFLKGTNHWNHFKLSDAIGEKWEDLKARDFSKVVVHRLTQDVTNDIPVDFLALLKSGERTKDVPLVWGDIIEIPKSENQPIDLKDEPDPELNQELIRYTQRTVEIKDGNIESKAVLIPRISETYGITNAFSDGDHKKIAYANGIVIDLGPFEEPDKIRIFETAWLKQLPLANEIMGRAQQMPINVAMGGSGMQIFRHEKPGVEILAGLSFHELVSFLENRIVEDLWLEDGDRIEIRGIPSARPMAPPLPPRRM